MTDNAAAASTLPGYFCNVRSEIAPLLPESCASILEIGCSAGGTLAWLRERWPDARLVGIDGYEGVRAPLERQNINAVIQNLEQPLPALGAFDLILALDVLEHLKDPLAVAQRLVQMLEPGGALIISVPNIANHSVLIPLIFRRRFAYADEGILDRTHLRFFTEESVHTLVSDAGLAVTGGLVTGFGPKQKFFNAATLGLFRHNLVWQYIVRAERRSARPFKWQAAR